jgi:hypothetical protein
MKKLILTALLVPAMALAQTYPSPTFNSVTLQNPLTPANGGTGVSNSNTITLGGNLTTTGANPLTFTTTGSTNITLPTSGTLLTTGSSTGTGAAVLATSPTIASPTITGAFTATGLVTTANTVLANATGSTASPTAFVVPSCSTSNSALQWTSGSGITCNSNITSIISGSAQVSLTTQASSISSATLYTTPSTGAGVYLAFVDLICTTAGSAGSVTSVIGWNNGAAGTTAQTGVMSLTTLGNEMTQSFVIFSAASQNITYSTTVTGAAGSPKYSIRIRLIYLG